MASQLVCDNCGMTANADVGVVGWLKLEANDRNDIRSFGRSTGPWDYCCLVCVAEGAGKLR